MLCLLATTGCNARHDGDGSPTGGGAGQFPGAAEGDGADPAGSTPPAPVGWNEEQLRALEPLLRQHVTWRACDPDTFVTGAPPLEGQSRCAYLNVPVSYDNIGGPTRRIAVAVVPATAVRTDPADIVPLVVNPGGPGIAVTDRIDDMADLSQQIRLHHDIVLVDPRGAGRSDGQVSCLPGKDYRAFLDQDTSPDTAAELAEVRAVARQLPRSCTVPAESLGEYSTRVAARDVDLVRGVLGAPRVDLLGWSYGTVLGREYARAFPEHLRRLVLDGIVRLDLPATEDAVDTARGLERGISSYAQWCLARRCAMGRSVEEVRAAFVTLFRDLDRRPLPVTGISDEPRLTESSARMAVLDALATADWESLGREVAAALRGDGQPLADRYVEAELGGDPQPASSVDAIGTVIRCADRTAARRDDAEVLRWASALERTAPVWGRYAAAVVECEEWPQPGVLGRDPIPEPPGVEVLILGATQDPMTPYEWAQQAAAQWPHARLLTLDGTGHTAYPSGRACLDDAVEAFLGEGIRPAPGTRCG